MKANKRSVTNCTAENNFAVTNIRKIPIKLNTDITDTYTFLNHYLSVTPIIVLNKLSFLMSFRCNNKNRQRYSFQRKAIKDLIQFYIEYTLIFFIKMLKHNRPYGSGTYHSFHVK